MCSKTNEIGTRQSAGMLSAAKLEISLASGRLQPPQLLRAKRALIREAMRVLDAVLPMELLREHRDAPLDLLLIRVAQIGHILYREPLGGVKDVRGRSLLLREGLQRLVDVITHRSEVTGPVVPRGHDRRFHREARIGVKHPLEHAQRRAGGGEANCGIGAG